MPLFMDIHYVGEISMEDTRKAHLADLAVKENMALPTISFGLMKKLALYIALYDTDKESCAATLREANGFSV